MSGPVFLWSQLSFGLVASSLAMLVIGASRRWRRSRGASVGLAVADERPAQRPMVVLIAIAAVLTATGLGAVPVAGVPLAGHLLAYSGQLSFATLFFLLAGLWQFVCSGGRVGQPSSWYGLQWGWIVVGTVLYATALSGRGPDVYAAGYGVGLAWTLLAISAIAAVGQRWLFASVAVGIVLAWQFRLSGATNLWDYAIDPFLFVGSVVQTSTRVGRSAARVGTNRRNRRKLATESEPAVSIAA